MIELIIYLTGVLFSIALYVFVHWKTKSPLYLDKLIAFAKKYQNTSAIDSQEVLEQLNKLSGNLKNQLSGLINKAQSEGWFDKIINFIKSLFN